MIWLSKLLAAIALIPLCGFLWSWGGAEGTSKNWRRLGVPTATSIFAIAAIVPYGFNGSIALIILIHWLLLFGALTLGYGHTSPLAKIWTRVLTINRPFHADEVPPWDLVNFCVRATVGAAYGGACCVLLLMRGVNVFLVCMAIPVIMTVGNTLLWGHFVDEPTGEIVFGKLLTWEEIFVGAGVGLAAALCV